MVLGQLNGSPPSVCTFNAQNFGDVLRLVGMKPMHAFHFLKPGHLAFGKLTRSQFDFLGNVVRFVHSPEK